MRSRAGALVQKPFRVARKMKEGMAQRRRPRRRHPEENGRALGVIGQRSFVLLPGGERVRHAVMAVEKNAERERIRRELTGRLDRTGEGPALGRDRPGPARS